MVELSDGDPGHGQTYCVHVGGVFSKTCKLHRHGDSVHQQVEASSPRACRASVIGIRNHHGHVSLSNPQRSSLDLTSKVWGASSSWSPLLFTALKGNVQWPVVRLIR